MNGTVIAVITAEEFEGYDALVAISASGCAHCSVVYFNVYGNGIKVPLVAVQIVTVIVHVFALTLFLYSVLPMRRI